jgi:protein-tyrosine phosphatase
MITLDSQRLIPMTNMCNLRDIGGYRTGNGKTLRWGRIYRSDSPHRLPEDSRQQLLGRGLKTVVDLRHDEETTHAPNVFADDNGVDYVNVSLFAGLSPELAPMGRIATLTEMYLHVLDSCNEQIAASILALGTGTPALVHCTAGKDRTGIIIAMLLDLCAVPHETILHDYALTDTYLEPLRPSLREFASEAGWDLQHYEGMIDCKPEFLQPFLTRLHDVHGGARQYLLAAGLSGQQLDAIVDQLTE